MSPFGQNILQFFQILDGYEKIMTNESEKYPHCNINEKNCSIFLIYVILCSHDTHISGNQLENNEIQQKWECNMSEEYTPSLFNASTATKKGLYTYTMMPNTSCIYQSKMVISFSLWY